MNHRQARLRELNRFDVERILNENIETLLGIEGENINDVDVETGSESENLSRLMGAQDSMAEVAHLVSLLHFRDDIEARILSGPLYQEGRG